MSTTTQELLAKASFYTDNRSYRLLSLPPQAITLAAGIVAETGESFTAMIVDKDEVSLIIPDEAVEGFSKRLLNSRIDDTLYQLLTIDIEVPQQLVGFMALLSDALARSGVSILPFSAFSRDHLLVPQIQFRKALETLEAIKQDYK